MTYIIVITIITIVVTVNGSIIWGVSCTGAMGVPAPVHVPGDCYVWGSSDPNSSGSKSAASTVPGWLNSSVPTLVDNTTHLDVCEVRAQPHLHMKRKEKTTPFGVNSVRSPV